MPNWCVGTLKVRGDRENIGNFLRGAFVCSRSRFSAEEPIIKEKEGLISVTAPGTCHHFYIKGSRRNFITCNSIEWYTDEQILLIPEYEAAWGIDTDVLTDLSAKYEIDIKIYAFEKGMQFNHDFEVHKGEIMKNKEIFFDCYAWECTVFRNESNYLSSFLIKLAVDATIGEWGAPPVDGIITYVDPKKINSVNPGCCFKKAGWQRIGKSSKRGLILLQVGRG